MLVCALLALVSTTSSAQIRTDGSLGRTAQNLAGPSYVIPQTLGSQSGNNLFFSFSTFNVNGGESATFTTTSTFANLISRVTGGSPSEIDGPIRFSGVGTPAFFFVNPAGIVFDASSSISVPGAFHASTANYLKFPDGRFYAGTAPISTLSSASPEAFGFLGTTRASIAFQNGATLANVGQPITVTAGDIQISDASVTTRAGGDIRIAAVGSASTEVPLTGELASYGGTLSIGPLGQVITRSGSPAAAGDIFASAGTISITGGSASGFAGLESIASSATTGNGGSIVVAASGPVTLTNNGEITSTTRGPGAAGNVTVSAPSMTIDSSGDPAAFTGIDSDAIAGTGSGGSIYVNVAGLLNILAGGLISAGTSSSGNAGHLTVAAGNLTIDASATPNVATGLFNGPQPRSTGQGGPIALTVDGLLTILNGGEVSTTTFASGNAGDIKVVAGNINIDASLHPQVETGIVGGTTSGSTGAGGAIAVNALGQLALTDGGVISSSTSGSGNAGSVSVAANLIHIANFTNPQVASGIFSTAYAGSGNGGDVQVVANTGLSILGSALIDSETYATGHAGNISVAAGNLVIQGPSSKYQSGILTNSNPGATGNAGDVDVAVHGPIDLYGGGLISSSTFGPGNAGDVNVAATALTVNAGTITSGGGITTSSYGVGDAGDVVINTSGPITLVSGGLITSDTYASGAGGRVTISADALTINGMASPNFFVGISSDAAGSGNAGDVSINVAHSLVLDGNGEISSSAFSTGNAGHVDVSAGSMTLEGSAVPRDNTGILSETQGGSGHGGAISVNVTSGLTILGNAEISSSTQSSGNAGKVSVVAGNILVDGSSATDRTPGVFSDALPGSSGSAGTVLVSTPGTLSLVNGGQITSNTQSSGSGGIVSVVAEDLDINGSGSSQQLSGIASKAETGSTGNAGSVNVSVSGATLITGYGQLNASTLGSGDAGTLTLASGSLTIDGSQSRSHGTGLYGAAGKGSTGAGGDVSVSVAGPLTLIDGGQISAFTQGQGSGGSVEVTAQTITIDGHAAAQSGIFASASGLSSGQTGNIIVTAKDGMQLSDGGTISISNAGTASDPNAIVPTLLSISSPNITLADASISAAATGNVGASDIRISFANQLRLDPSAITTSSILGNGGSIDILGGAIVELDNSQITTSVAGRSGNGGDIRIDSEFLVLNSGFVQANTSAARAAGGDIVVDTQNVVPSGSSLFVGGNTLDQFEPTIFGFNVIQAAAPTGVSGSIQIANPVLDIAGTLVPLNANLLAAGGLARSRCAATRESSLAIAGHGGFAASAREHLHGESKPQSPLGLTDARDPLSVVYLGCARQGTQPALTLKTSEN